MTKEALTQSSLFSYWRKPKVLDITGWSSSTLYRQEKSGDFPKRYRLSSNVIAYRSDQVLEWMSSRALVDGGSAHEV